MNEKRPPQPYGPFSAEVRQFLQRLATFSPVAEELVLSQYLVAQASAEYQAAERELGSAIARSGRERERDALGGPLLLMLRVDMPRAEPTSATSNATLTPNTVTPNTAANMTLTPNTAANMTLTPNTVIPIAANATLTPNTAADMTLTPNTATPMAAQPNMPLTRAANAPTFRPIAEPALAALLAVLMQDVLSAELFARLYAPFAQAIPHRSLQQ